MFIIAILKFSPRPITDLFRHCRISSEKEFNTNLSDNSSNINHSNNNIEREDNGYAVTFTKSIKYPKET